MRNWIELKLSDTMRTELIIEAIRHNEKPMETVVSTWSYQTQWETEHNRNWINWSYQTQWETELGN